jgi:DNA-directed RNA polymerase I subunit RPA2
LSCFPTLPFSYSRRFRNRGSLFTKFGITIRCVRPDLSSQTLTLHYLEDGSACVRISLKKQEYFIPVVMLLKAMTGASDREIYDAVVQGNYDNTFVTDRIESAIKAVAMHPFVTQQQFLCYLGARFRTSLNVPEHYDEEQCGLFLLQQHMFIHLPAMSDKFNMLVYMMQKLYLFVAGDICGDNVDACSSFDVLLPGHMILKMLKEKLQEWLLNMSIQFRRDLRIDKARARLEQPSYLNNLIYKNTMDIGKKIESFLATGNLNSPSGLDLMQVHPIICVPLTCRHIFFAGKRFHHHRRKNQLFSLPRAFQKHSPWCVFQRDEDNQCAQTPP